jgi:hypothetical protein
MPSTYSPLKIELPATGEQSGTWGNTTNTNLGTALEEAIVGSASVTFASGNVTLTLTDTNASQPARNLRLNLIGVTGGSTRTLTVPAIEKLYLVSNNCADPITVGNTTGATVTVPAGNNIFIYNDGTDVLNAITYITALNAVSVSAGTVNAVTVDTTNIEVTNIKAKDGTASATIADSTGVMTIGSSVLTTTDINGGTIDGAVIGGASAAAGNFTTLGATGVATFSAGTVSAPALTTTGDTNTGIFFPAADTIAFTEGGVESMRIDSSGNVGVGTSSPSSRLDVSGVISLQGTTLPSAGTSRIYSRSSDSSTYIQTATSGSINLLDGSQNTMAVFGASILQFMTGNTERMRIDSAGFVGIGTSSPSNVLSVVRNQNTTSRIAITNSDTTNTSSRATLQATSGAVTVDATAITGLGGFMGTTTNHPLQLITNGNGRVIIDTSGNIGIGVIPSTWVGLVPAIEIGGAGSFIAAQGDNFDVLRIGTNATYDGSNFKYKISAPSTLYFQYNGEHIWESASSGTAGNTITFTERMRITSAGDVGIGTSTPGSKLAIGGYPGGFNTALNFGANGDNFFTSGTSGSHIFRTAGTERMRIDSSGNVGIGTSSPKSDDGGNKLEISNNANTVVTLTATNDSTPLLNFRSNSVDRLQIASSSTFGAYFLVRNNQDMRFGTNNDERMRILSGGSVCVNTTAAVVDSTSRLIVSTTTANGVAAEFSNSTSGTCAVAINNSGAATSTLINWIAAGSYRAAVTWNGTNIIYGTPSDQRLKENIVDSSSALISINNIKIRSFDFKENGNHVKFGVIAQELESIFPEAVLKGIDNEDGSIKESWSVDTSTLVPMLVKAIQEQQALIENLTTRLNALEGK